MKWYRNLQIVLSFKDKLPFLEQPIPAMRVPLAGQVLPPDVLNTHTAWVKAQKEIASLMLMTMDPDIQKNLEHLGAFVMLKELKTLYVQQADQELLQTIREFHAMEKTVTKLHAMLKLHEQTLPPKEVAPALHAIRAGKSRKTKIKNRMRLLRGINGKAKQRWAMHMSLEKKLSHLSRRVDEKEEVMSRGIFTIEFYSFPSTSWVYDTGCGTHICITTQGLRGSKKLKPGALRLYVGDGHRVAVEAIGEFHLCLSSGLDDIYEIVLSSSNTNDSSMYDVSNKRVKLYLDSALLWRCHLGHISKKRIEKLQLDGLFDSTDIKSFEKCVSCMSGKMARKPYSHQVERPTNLPGLIHTDVCGPFKIMSMGLLPIELLLTRHNIMVFERRNRTLLDMVRSMMSQTTLPKFFWDYAIESAARILKMVPTKKDDQEIDEPQSDINLIRGFTRTRCAPDRMCLYIDAEEHELGDLGELANYKATLLDTKSEKWLNAMNVEMQSMKDNEVWELVDLPSNSKTVGHKWLFKKKIGMDGAIHTYKARLVAKGFTQNLGIDYEENSSPVADIRAIRILIAISAFYDYEIWQMDVKTAFLNGILNEENPGEVQSAAVKNILKYLRNIKDMFLIYEDDTKRELMVSCYTDAGCLTTKQSIFATSSTNADYIADFDTSKEAVWIQKFIFGLGIVPTIEEPINMYYDNTGAIAIANDHGVIKGARHFRAKVHYLRETIEMGDVKIEKIDTDDNLANPFTKALAFLKHYELTEKIRMISASSLI
nr:hypothetical protein [Tanacetum cinerariifolium]